jgi:prepilin-type N-terminal cleavage/methylation domain-containing protein
MCLAANRGVSLAEMLIALAILAVISSLAVPAYSSLTKRFSLNQSSRQVVTDLQFAKMHAISEGVQYQVKFNNSTISYVIEKGNASLDSTSWSPIQIARSLQTKSNPYFSNGIALIQNFPNDRAIFSPTGTSNMGTIKLCLDSCNDGKTICQASPKRSCEKCITALLSGRIGIVQ